MVIVLAAETHPAAACRLHSRFSKMSFFYSFPREIGLSLYDAVIKACGKAGFKPKIGQLRAANFVSH